MSQANPSETSSMKKAGRVLTKIAVLCVAFQDIGQGATTPALQSIMDAFPTVDPSLVMMISSIPPAGMVIFSLVYAQLVKVLSKRTILIIAAICFAVGGITPAFMDNIYLILLMRVLVGIATGFCFPMGMDLCVDYFEGRERQTMFGWVSAASGIGGIIYQTLGGYLASLQWNYCFYAYIPGVAMFIIAWVLLPRQERREAARIQEESKEVLERSAPERAMPGKIRMPASTWIVCVLFFLWAVFFFVVMTNSSSVIVGEGIGSAAIAGLSISVITVGSTLSALFFGRFQSKVQNLILPVMFGLTTVGFLMFFFSYSVLMCMVSSFVIGVGMGLAMPAVVSVLTGYLSEAQATKAISFTMASNGLGSFTQPMIFAVIFQVTGMSVGRAPFLVSTVAFAILTVVTVVFVNMMAKKQKVMP
jgi:MFS family permease